jgi:hypothetical protein
MGPVARLTGGSLPPDLVVGIPWNRWSPSHGIDGRNAVDYAPHGKCCAAALEFGLCSVVTGVFSSTVASAGKRDWFRCQHAAACELQGWIAAVGNNCGETVGDTETVFGLGQQLDATIEANPSTVEGCRDLLSADGWRIESVIDTGGWRGSFRCGGAV